MVGKAHWRDWDPMRDDPITPAMVAEVAADQLTAILRRLDVAVRRIEEYAERLPQPARPADGRGGGDGRGD